MRTGLAALLHFPRVIILILWQPGPHTEGRVILTAHGSQLARTGGCDLPQLTDRVRLRTRARRDSLRNVHLRDWVDFTCARNESQKRLVHQRGRLQRLPRFLLGQLRRRQLAEFVVHQRQQLVRRRRIAGFNLGQDACNVRHATKIPQAAAHVQMSLLLTHTRQAVTETAWLRRRPQDLTSGVSQTIRKRLPALNRPSRVLRRVTCRRSIIPLIPRLRDFVGRGNSQQLKAAAMHNDQRVGIQYVRVQCSGNVKNAK